MTEKQFSADSLKLDAVKETTRIIEKIRILLSKQIKRRGLVVAVSGGIDSSVTLGLAVKALGPDRVLALLMPERHSSNDTLDLSTSVVDTYNVDRIHEDITSILEAVGFYKRYTDAVRRVIPEYGDGWKSKIALPGASNNKGFNLFSVIACAPDGTFVKKRLSLQAYLEIVAATNFKQRIRKMLEYYHADRLNYAVAGTPNRLEYDQGFFVKLGDGAADIKPIAHLYKTQVYQIAEYLDVPEQVRLRSPTTDTYSLEQGQDEFYFMLPYREMDLCLYAKNNNVPVEVVADIIGLTSDEVKFIFEDIDRKRNTTRYMHMQPLLIDKVEQIRF